MAAFEINYISGKEDIDRADRFSVILKSTFIDFSNLTAKFSKYITAYKANTLADVRFNMYSLIGLPDNSYIEFYQQTRLNREVIWRTFSQRFDTFGDETLSIEPGNSIFFRYRFGAQKFPGIEENKIHLQVKHEYILHCILKLMPLKDLFPEYAFTWKFNLWNRDSNLRPNDHLLREANNGVAATFVLYGSSDPVIMIRILTELLRLFPNDAEMGVMDLNATDTLTAGHVRLNHMISYASTDRGSLIKRIEANVAKFPEAPTMLPPWIGAMAESCSADTKEAVNKESQLYIGMDVCDAEGKPIDYERMCNTAPRTKAQSYCYMPVALIDPRTIRRSGGSKTQRGGSKTQRRGYKLRRNTRRMKRV